VGLCGVGLQVCFYAKYGMGGIVCRGIAGGVFMLGMEWVGLCVAGLRGCAVADKGGKYGTRFSGIGVDANESQQQTTKQHKVRSRNTLRTYWAARANVFAAQ
jgi:hypothetical protein